MSANAQEPGLIAGHAQFAKGATVEAIGSVTGSEERKASGAEQKSAGAQEMKEAGENRNSNQGMGRVEELAGKAIGCEGMENEGTQSKEA